MRLLIVVCFVAVVTLAGSPASAQDVESLRREVEALRKQLQSVTERLQVMEARPAAPSPPPVSPVAPVTAPAPLAQAPATTATESATRAPTLADYARPHQPFALARFDIRQVDTVEDRPGIPPSPGHLVQLIRRMRDEKIKAILVSAWNDRRTAERVAAEAGARVVLLAHGAGALKGTETYFDFFDYNVKALIQALE